LKSETPCERVEFWRQSRAPEEFAREGAKDAKANFFFAGFAPSREMVSGSAALDMAPITHLFRG
jgi:hypothetical protein